MIWYTRLMNPSNFALNLVLFAVIVIVGWRLWRVLGTRTGFEQTHDSAAPLEQAQTAQLPHEDLPPIWQDHAKEGSVLANTLVDMAKIDPALNPSDFLVGAKIVHTKVLEAFSAGRLASVENLISPPVLETLRSEVKAREKKAETLNYKLVGYDSVRIVSASLDGNFAKFNTRFETRLVSWTSDAAGKVVIGNPNKTESHVDHWTFERDLTSHDPNWLLVETDTEDVA